MSMLLVNVNMYLNTSTLGGNMWVGLISSRAMAVCYENGDEPSF